MADIKEQKLLYHLTALDNLESIIEMGLLPRSQLESKYLDVADLEIIDSRRTLGLDDYVPFHFFARNPFDGRVQVDHPDTIFVLIAVRRVRAKRLGWKIIPCHPLANEEKEILEYDEGIEAIDWNKMNARDYHDEESKSVCMAECLSPIAVPPTKFFDIFVPDADTKTEVAAILIKLKRVNLVDITVNKYMFI